MDLRPWPSARATSGLVDNPHHRCRDVFLAFQEHLENGGQLQGPIWEALPLSATYYTSGASAIISSTSEEFKPVGKSRYVIVFLRLMGWIFFVPS
jgi:hypothetical protein